MNKLFVFALLATVMASCSDDAGSNNENQDFFEIAEGNLWVYQRYYVSSTGTESTYGEIDSVRVTGQQVVDGETYFKFNQRKYSGSGSLHEERVELLRVNEEGRLVNDYGFVMHPGGDAAYQFVRPVQTGTMTYQLEEMSNVIIEGQNYTVSPYAGYYTPAPDVNYLPGIGERISYAEGIGKIVHRCRYLNSEAYFEDRLIYYELN